MASVRPAGPESGEWRLANGSSRPGVRIGSPFATRHSPLLHLFARIDAPEPLLTDVAVEVAGAWLRDRDAAPRPGALLHAGDDVRLQAGEDVGALVGAFVQRDRRIALQPRRDERGAPAREQRVQHPSLGALGVADTPPGLELRDDLDGQPGALEHPR